MEQYLLGYDLGSSSVKAALLNIDSGECVAEATSPATEMEMLAEKPGWAEQHPDLWWEHVKKSTAALLKKSEADPGSIRAIGISYQMHGLVTVDKNLEPVRPSIIWCDSRAAPIGEKAFEEIGEEYCLSHFLNSPGNFTASKLKWVMEYEPEVYDRIYKIMLPGDYIAMKMTGRVTITKSGLSEGILWNYKEEKPADKLLSYFGISRELIPDQVQSFGDHGELTQEAAAVLGLRKGIKISYRAGDQPNNAFSLNVMHPGEAATTAGTSGVIYGVLSSPGYDPKSRVNTFLHVNHAKENPRYGVLLCVNGTGIANSWIRRLTGGESTPEYAGMNRLASGVQPGSDGILVFPFGNGAERMFENRDVGAHILGLNFNRHGQSHIYRAVQEGIAFSLAYGFDILRKTGVTPDKVKAGRANLFLSDVFREIFVNTTGSVLEFYNTNGAAGAARGAGIGTGIYAGEEEAFRGLKMLRSFHPKKEKQNLYADLYNRWKTELTKFLNL